MSCDCNSGGGDAYNNFCNADIPYPSVSHESVPSMMDNLTLALYGLIQKDVSSGKVKWIIPCDPTNSATVFGITRNANEGLMCYFIRAFQDTQAVTFIPAGQYGQILSSAGTNYLAWVTPAAGNVPGALVQRDSGGNFSASVVSANLNGSLQGGFPGSLVYQSDSTHTTYLSVGSLNQVLLSNGTLPAWATLAGSAYVDTTNASNISSGTLPAGRLPAFSGEVTSSIGSAVLALTPTGVSAGAYNVIQSGVARVPQVTVDSKGRLSNVTMVTLAASAVTDTTNATNISSGTLAAGRLPASGAIAATYGATTPQFLTVTVDTYGRITAISKQSDYVAYTLPTATASVLGGVKIGSNLTITGGVLSADATPLPIATASVLGGIKVGSNLTINPTSGVLSADATPLPIASVSVLGGIKVGSNLTINPTSGVLSANATPLLPATTSALGGVIVGSGLTVSETGLISVPGGSGTTVTTFTGTGSQLTFGTLNGFISTDPQGYIVSVGGIDQRPTTDFTIQAVLATGNIVFAAAPPSGATILVRAIKAALAQDANRLQGNLISSTGPIGNQYLGWDVVNNVWKPRDITTFDVSGLATALDGKAPTARTITAGTGLTGGGDLTADRTLQVSYGTTAGTAAQGDDSRLSNARTPTAHASNHQSGGSDQITSLALTTGTVSTAPEALTDLVNKAYVDSIASGVNFHDACDYGTIEPLSPAANYNQPGGPGVGVLATLTGSLNTALQVDGVTVTVGKRILVKNQASSVQNGIYNVTRQGDGATLPYILTRASDYDTSGSGTGEVSAGDFILVLGGTIANTAWVQQTLVPIVFGTISIFFIQFAAPAGGVSSFSGGATGLTPAGAATGAVTLEGILAVTNGGTGATQITGLVKGTGATAMTGAAAGIDYSYGTSGLATGLVKSTTGSGDLSIAAAGTDYVTPSGNITGTAANVSGIVAVDHGGTGQTTYTNGQILIGNTTGNTLAKATLTAGASGNITITNGASAITIESNPRVITASDTATALRITQLGTGEALRVEDETNPDASPTVITNNGNVGIGTAAPISVNGNASKILGISGAINNIVNFTNTSTSGAGIFEFTRTGRLPLGRFAQLQVQNSADDGYFSFLPSAAGADAFEQMRIDKNGVGINNAAPSQKLDVVGVAKATSFMQTATIATIGATYTVDLSSGTIFTLTLTSATPSTITLPSVSAGQSFTLIIKQPATGTVTTVAYAGTPTIRWAGGVAPTMTATLGKADIISFSTDGTSWFGSAVKNF